MSVVVSKRDESKYDAISYSVDLRKMMTELMLRNFGIRDVDQWVRLKYAYGEIQKENFSKYRFLMQRAQERVDMYAALITANLRDAYSRFPTNMHEFDRRRDCQNNAIGNCEALLKELQHIVDVFDVDINVYERYVKAIDKQIFLIKRWRQRDNKMKRNLQ